MLSVIWSGASNASDVLLLVAAIVAAVGALLVALKEGASRPHCCAVASLSSRSVCLRVRRCVSVFPSH